MALIVLIDIFAPRLRNPGKPPKGIITKLQMSAIKTALGNYEVRVGSFPTTAQGLQALVSCPSDVPKAKWGNEKYMDRLPVDGWERPFRYACPSTDPGRAYDLISAGSDRKFGTKDDIVFE